MLGQPGHCSLESVAVHVRKARNRDAVAFVRHGWLDPGLDACDQALGQDKPDGARPPGGKQRRCKPEVGHGSSCLAPNISDYYPYK